MPEAQEHKVYALIEYRDESGNFTSYVAAFAPGPHLSEDDPEKDRLLSAREGESQLLDLGFAHELRAPGEVARAEERTGWSDYPATGDSDLFDIPPRTIFCSCEASSGERKLLMAGRVYEVPVAFSDFVTNYLSRKATGQRRPDCLFLRRVRGEL